MSAREAGLPGVDWTLFTDRCERCIVAIPPAAPVLPYAVTRDPDEFIAHYSCPQCVHTWFTCWDARFITATAHTTRSIPDVLTRVIHLLRDGKGGNAA